MDCRTAHLLIEAFHDDELGLVEAATLLSHLDVCPDCERRNEAARRLKSVFRETRPVVQCPEALKKRLSRRVEHTRRFPRAIPPSVTLFVVAAGFGLLVGEVLPLRGGAPTGPAAPLAEVPVKQRLSGEVFCLRCALERLVPGGYQGTPHRPVLHTADGRLLTVLPAGGGAGLGRGSCAARHVDVLGEVYPESGLVRVVTASAAAVPTPAIPALTLAKAQ